jgi:hypothetical protein
MSEAAREPTRCDGCGATITEAEEDRLVLRLLLPHGISHDQTAEAVRRALGEVDQLSVDEKEIALMMALLKKRGRDLDFTSQLHLGRALRNLGGIIVQLHPECVDASQTTYRTEAWPNA